METFINVILSMINHTSMGNNLFSMWTMASILYLPLFIISVIIIISIISLIKNK